MKKIVLLSILTLGLASISFGQSSFLNNRLNFKLGYSKIPSLSRYNGELLKGTLWLEGNFGHSKLFESGVYLGYTNFSDMYITENHQIITSPKISNAFFYGVNTNFHIMPLFNFANEPRIDVYISGKAGFGSFISPKHFFLSGTSFDAGVFGGINYYIFRRLGVYAEYGYYIMPRANFFDPGFKLGITLKY